MMKISAGTFAGLEFMVQYLQQQEQIYNLLHQHQNQHQLQ